YDESLAPPDQIAVKRKQDFMPHPIDLLVLNVLYEHDDDLHCFEIARRVYDLTNARVTVSDKQVWLALRRLIKADWVERVSRDRDAGRRKSALYRLCHGGGSHLRSVNMLWRKLAP